MTPRWPIRWPPLRGAAASGAVSPMRVRHREKWRLALDMIEEMTRPGGWDLLDLAGCARPVVAADIGYGDNALFRRHLTAVGWQDAVAVKGSTSADDGDAVPGIRLYGGLGQPPKPAYARPPVTLRQLALAHAAQIRPGRARPPRAEERLSANSCALPDESARSFYQHLREHAEAGRAIQVSRERWRLRTTEEPSP